MPAPMHSSTAPAVLEWPAAANDGSANPVADWQPASRGAVRLALMASVGLHALFLFAGGSPAGSSMVTHRDETKSEVHAKLLTAVLRSLPPPSPRPAAQIAPPALVVAETLMPAAAPPAAPAKTTAEQAPLLPVPPPMPATAQDERFGIFPGELPQTDTPVYFKPSELDVRAAPMDQVFPQPTLPAPTPVTIRLRLFISVTGVVDKIEVVEVSPADYPADFAVDAFKKMRFDPARIAGEPVASQKVIELNLAPG
jgi:hypothetical protein